jgi:predicted Fe-Mo cluster-binding NifX family protein
MERVQRLKELETEILVCGGIPNNLHEILLSNGIEVFPWETGNTKDILEKFLIGQTKSKIPSRRKKHRVVKRTCNDIDS